MGIVGDRGYKWGRFLFFLVAAARPGTNSAGATHPNIILCKRNDSCCNEGTTTNSWVVTDEIYLAVIEWWMVLSIAVLRDSVTSEKKGEAEKKYAVNVL
jgi:hypothetical protein